MPCIGLYAHWHVGIVQQVQALQLRAEAGQFGQLAPGGGVKAGQAQRQVCQASQLPQCRQKLLKHSVDLVPGTVHCIPADPCSGASTACRQRLQTRPPERRLRGGRSSTGGVGAGEVLATRLRADRCRRRAAAASVRPVGGGELLPSPHLSFKLWKPRTCSSTSSGSGNGCLEAGGGAAWGCCCCCCCCTPFKAAMLMLAGPRAAQTSEQGNAAFQQLCWGAKLGSFEASPALQRSSCLLGLICPCLAQLHVHRRKPI